MHIILASYCTSEAWPHPFDTTDQKIFIGAQIPYHCVEGNTNESIKCKIICLQLPEDQDTFRNNEIHYRYVLQIKSIYILLV